MVRYCLLEPYFGPLNRSTRIFLRVLNVEDGVPERQALLIQLGTPCQVSAPLDLSLTTVEQVTMEVFVLY